jgi:hypothetical protein
MMEHSSSQAIHASSISQRVVESLSRLHLPFENLLLAWFILSPIASFYFRFPLDKSLITFDRIVVLGLVLMLLVKVWQTQINAKRESQMSNSPIRHPDPGLRATDYGLGTFSITKFEIAWLFLSAMAFLNALLQSTNVTYAVKIAIDSFFLPLVVFHVARYHFNWRERENILLMAAIALALILFATGIYEFFTGANLLAYKGSAVLREGELRVNGPFASDSSYAIICLLMTLFLRLLPRLLQIKFDKSARLVYLGALAASAVATLLPLFRAVGFALLLCSLAIEYFIHSKRNRASEMPDGTKEIRNPGEKSEGSVIEKSEEDNSPLAAAAPRPVGGSQTKRLRRVVIYSTIASVLLVGFVAWNEISGSFLIGRLASPRNFYGRLASAQTAVLIALDNPVAGVGLTNYSAYFDVIFSDWQHQDVAWVNDIRAAETPHSNFLWIASELGFSGLAPYLLANAYLLLMGFRALRRAKTRQQLIASGGFVVLFAAYTLSGLTLQSGFYSDLNLYFFFMLGLLANIFAEPQT